MATPSVQDSDPEELNPAQSVRIIRDQRDRVRQASPDGRLLFGVWGLAWLVGYLALWFSADRSGEEPSGWAWGLFAALLASAMVVTAVHITIRTRGVRGPSSRAGAMYGWTWFLGFVSYGFILGGLARLHVSGEAMVTVANGGACLIVGILYMASGAIFDEVSTFVIGAWVLVVAAVAAMAGLPTTLLVMALLGGGGMLVLALGDQIRRTRQAAAASRAPGGQQA